MGVEVRRKASEIVEVNPVPQAKSLLAKKALCAIRLLQEIESQSIGASEITVKIKDRGPINIFGIGDLHYGSLSTFHDGITELKKAILKPGVYAVLLGDLIEGGDITKISTINPPINPQQQAMVLREDFLKPLAAKGKIIAAVSDHFAHEGWSQEKASIDLWAIMFAGLEIPRIRQGGRLTVVLSSGEEFLMQLQHTPGGRSEVDPVYGLRKTAFGISLEKRPDVFAAGHYHESGVAQELFPDTGDIAMVLLACGTVKGSDEDIPADRFGVKLGGKKLPSPLGQGVIARKERHDGNGRSKRTDIYPYHEAEPGNELHQALRLLEKVDRQRQREELLEKIKVEVQNKPIVKMDKRGSTETHTRYMEFLSELDGDERRTKKVAKGAYAAQYETIRYRIITRLPFAVDLFQNARLGSHAEGTTRLKQHINEFELTNPNVFALFLRAMIDGEVGSRLDRQAILDGLVNIIDPIKNQTLAILLDENLRSSAYKRTLHEETTKEERKADPHAGEVPPIAPGTYLSLQTDTPLVHHLSHIKLAVASSESKLTEKLPIDIVVADKLHRSGSVSKPTFGLRRLYDLALQKKPSLVVGGHMISAGCMTFFDATNPITKSPSLIEPGWYANYVDTLGKGNVSPGAEPGQAVIFVPGVNGGEHMAFPTISERQTKDLFAALTLYKGLNILGLTDVVTTRNYRKS